MSQLTNTANLVSQMETQWLANGGGSFHFGNPQEVDQIHTKTLPLMVVNSPICQMNIDDVSKSTYLTSSSWTLTVYDNLPSSYNVTNDQTILGLWDSMETKVLNFFEDYWNHFIDNGQSLVMTENIRITRLKESSNDRLLAIKITLGFNFWRQCLELN